MDDKPLTRLAAGVALVACGIVLLAITSLALALVVWAWRAIL